MDDTHIDALAKGLGTSGSRRRALAAFVGVTLAGSLGRVDGTAKGGRQHRHRRRLASEDGTCKADGKACKKHSQCCSGTCLGATGGSTAHSDGVCGCVAEGLNCTAASECCQTTPTSCAHSGNNLGETSGPTRCCRAMGASCTTRLGCCMTSDAFGQQWGIICSPLGICGGPGAPCPGGGSCVSGSCNIPTFTCN